MLGLETLVKVTEALGTRALRINPVQCSRARHKLSKCALCIDHCPARAIGWGERLELNSRKCTGCGICVNVCPNGVFEAREPTSAVVLARANEVIAVHQEAVFVCRRYQQGQSSGAGSMDNLLVVACLGGIDEALLVGCVALGAGVVWLVDGPCRECEWKAGQSVARATVDKVNTILGMFGIQPRVFIAPELPAPAMVRAAATHSPPPPDRGRGLYSRRDFFRFATHETGILAAIAAGGVIENLLPEYESQPGKARGGLPFCVPEKRRMLLEFLRKLGDRPGSPAGIPHEQISPRRMKESVIARSPRLVGATKQSPALPPGDCFASLAMTDFRSNDGLPFGQLTIDTSCIACGMCAFFCPTGALKKLEKDGQKLLTFQPGHCTRCNLCRDICYRRAIRILPDLAPQKLLAVEPETLFTTPSTPAPSLRELLGL